MYSEVARSRDIAVIDENSEYLGVERRLLMENAGAEVARFIEESMGSLRGRRVVILAGPGNNGGDAMVAARHIAARGAVTSLFLLSEESRIRTPEARDNWETVKKMRLSVDTHLITEIHDLARFSSICRAAEIVVDGIFGTGVKGDVREPAKSVIETVNSSGAIVFSIDVPSGMDPDSGLTPPTCIEADYTITLHAPKPFIARADKRLTGQVVIRGIGAPPEAGLLAGPGDLSEALRVGVKKGRIRGRVGDGEMAEAVRETAGLLGLEASLEQAREGGGGYLLEMEGSLVSDDEDIVRAREDAFYARLGPDSPQSFSIQVADQLREEARRLGRVIYAAGGVDYISDGERVKTNWIEPPVPNAFCFGAAVTLALVLRASGSDKLYAISGSAYAVRSVLRVMEGSFSRGRFLSLLESAVKHRLGAGR